MNNYGYGKGFGFGFGAGSGLGSGLGSGYGSGSGSGSGSSSRYGYYGYYGNSLSELCGGYSCELFMPWQVLRIGYEVHTFQDWIDNAEEIDNEHGDGIADQTRALALSLLEGQQ